MATVAILVNVLLMQSGKHPAPMFKGDAQAKPAAVTQSALPPATTVPRSRPAEAVHTAPVTSTPLPPPARTVSPPAAVPQPAPAAAVRTPGAIITDIQRELARRGFFDGAVDGFYGPKTDRAIREFEQAAGLKQTTDPSEAVLQSILRAPARIAKGTNAAPPVARPAPVRNDVAAERPAPSKRVIAIQRVLSEFGYGQIRPTGIVDAETQSAIEKFERERKLPVTGQASDRVARELAVVTGRPVE
jgi:peptidoglycan hydrolase-like protein with peptidoglycan-binding domain